MTINDTTLHTYEVTYKILHTRVFRVPNQKYIECLLNEHNDVEIIDIIELPNEVSQS